MIPTKMAITPIDSNPCFIASLVLATTLEQPGDQPPANLVRILGIAWKISREEVLFIREPPDEQGHKAKDSEQPVPRIERERQAEDQEKRASIHRMTHQRIRAR